jgi:DNA-directed RNA polymerase subunit RPC12/RpoP
MKCFVCGNEEKLVRPLQTPVWGNIKKVAFIGVCLSCWNKNESRAEIRDVGDSIQCETCGTKEGVSVSDDPYEKDVNDKLVKVALCSKCYQERCLDI